MRRFKGDKFTRVYGSAVPVGATVLVRRFFPRRRVLVEYNGQPYMTMLWCLEKMA